MRAFSIIIMVSVIFINSLFLPYSCHASGNLLTTTTGQESFLSVALKTSSKATVSNTTNFTVLKKKLTSMLSSKKGFYSIGIENFKTGENIYINPVWVKSASVIKVFVMASVFRKIKEGKLDPNKQLTLEKWMKVGGTGILQGARVGTKKTILQLTELMITVSDNTAANMIVRTLGFSYINDTIKKLGCKDTILGYYFILDAPKGVMNTTSTKDLNLLFEKLYTNTFLGKQYDQQMINIMKKTQNNTKLSAKLPKNTVVAHKTGCIIRHEHDAGIVFSNAADYAISILCRDVPNSTDTYSTIADISRVVYDYINKP